MEYTDTLQDIKKRQWIFPLCLILYELPLYFATNMYLPALPEMRQTFGIEINIAQLTIAIWFLGASCFQIFLGPLADHFGYRKVLLNGGLFFIGASFLCATTQYISLFLIARFIQGCVVSSILVAGYATLHELLDTEQAIKTLSWMGSITVLAPAIGPLMGSFLIKIMNWQNIFLLLASIAAIALYLLYLYMPERAQKKKNSIAFKLILRNYQKVLLSKDFLYYTFLFCLLFSSMVCWDTFSPFYIINFLGLSVIGFGLVQTIIYGGFIVGTRLLCFFMKNINKLIRYGLFSTLFFSILAVLSLLIIPMQIGINLFFMTAFTLSTGLIFYVLHRKAIEAIEVPMGIKMAVFSSAMNLFGFLGSVVATTLQL